MSERNIKCGNCGRKSQLIKIEEYHLDIAGLPNIWLLAATGYECNHCGDQGIILPAFGLLMQTIAETVIFKNESYTSQEMCFLKKYLDLTGREVANKLGTSEKTVSFWMTGKTKVSPVYGIKLRKLFTNEFYNLISRKKEKNEELKLKLKSLLRETSRASKEKDLFDFLKVKAQQSANKKIREANIFSRNGDAPMFRIPDSRTQVQLRG